jgi:thioesterase domain-containing protein
VSVAAFLAELRRCDVQVWSDGNELRCNAPAGTLTKTLRTQLGERKAEILRFLRSAEAARQQLRAIVPLHPHGPRTPVFAVGGHNGDVFCYRSLSRCLGSEQPFFGLRPPGLDGECAPLTSIPDLAAHFAGQMLTFQSGGGFIVAGYCAGGAIAFEVARQLQARGAAVELVALFAGRYPTWFGRLSQLRHRAEYYAGRLDAHARMLVTGAPTDRWRHLASVLDRGFRDTAAPRARPDDPPSALVAKVQHATMAAIRGYRPEFFPGRLALFLPSARTRRPADGLLRWRALAREVTEHCGPPGCVGDSMLLEPHVRVMAELFRACCDHYRIS